MTTFGALVKSALGDHWSSPPAFFIRWSAIRSATSHI